MTRTRAKAVLRPAGAAGAHMLVIGAVYLVYTLSLVFQGKPWHRTPAYGNLLVIMPASTWGVFFGTAAALLLVAAYRRRPLWLAYTAVLVAVMLTTCWDIAFLIRYATSSSTTPETWTSWGVFLYMLLRAGVLLDRERDGGHSPAPGG